MRSSRQIELLAPAKNLECGMAAIRHGADAVYIGAERFGARAAAGNSIGDIQKLCEFAHKFLAKVYVTVNTILYDDELDETLDLLDKLDEAGIDAVLVQDMALVEAFMAHRDNWRMAMHASTQTDNRSVDKVRWLCRIGFSRVVLARELSLDNIKEIHMALPDVELEAFVHGALCVSFSGLCYASQYCFGRSANRGECAQFCRLRFNLVDADGHVIERNRHLLSLKDMCRYDDIEAMLEVGVTSFKIEGRLKDLSYVKNVTAAYSKRLDEIVARSNGRYQRASIGRCKYSFASDLNKTFNRGFTNYFLYGRQPDIYSFDTPKAMGEFVGKVKEIRGNSFIVSSMSRFANGDGLCFFNEKRELEGFRVNKAVNNRLFPLKMPQDLRPGTALFRNNDIEFERILAGVSSQRKIPVVMELRETEEGFELVLNAERGITASAQLHTEKLVASSSQRDNIVRIFTKLGTTAYECSEIRFTPSDFDYFIPSSILADLRRRAVAELDEAMYSKVKEVHESTDYESPCDCLWEYDRYTYSYNIANERARRFYKNMGFKDIADAYEITQVKEPLLMQCRHCLRYSLGYCVKNGGKQPVWREPLYLSLADGKRFRLQFDCSKCQMNVFADEHRRPRFMNPNLKPTNK